MLIIYTVSYHAEPIFFLLGQLSRLGLLNTPIVSLQRGKTRLLNEFLGYDTKPSDSEVLIWSLALVAITRRSTPVQSDCAC